MSTRPARDTCQPQPSPNVSPLTVHITSCGGQVSGLSRRGSGRHQGWLQAAGRQVRAVRHSREPVHDAAPDPGVRPHHRQQQCRCRHIWAGTTAAAEADQVDVFSSYVGDNAEFELQYPRASSRAFCQRGSARAGWASLPSPPSRCSAPWCTRASLLSSTSGRWTADRVDTSC